MKKSEPLDDAFQIRCPRLGHQIAFSYCRHENRGAPCFKTLDCWHEHFLVEEHLRVELSAEQMQDRLERRPKPKMVSLLELIEQAARNRTED